jgi:hypothetical protein
MVAAEAAFTAAVAALTLRPAVCAQQAALTSQAAV